MSFELEGMKEFLETLFLQWKHQLDPELICQEEGFGYLQSERLADAIDSCYLGFTEGSFQPIDLLAA
ncbi:hypothetical protein [Corynebacterium pseudodiphtheriticum]|uniref:Uncharacterized protein n=1 Tax=Siphoviridae sp. ctGkF2 TaxID=2827823 RepID=A0A8S5TL17_9CAUD|nr:hypothetical protein [Corynebacterium pseudodiphtheriticum]MDK4206961.1 hypothetical protein [Corynebacterium pseudodiphtheriticum]DAF64006.1 MAG TPA: hypothetical protein [Siphoviridae sp. ctGkF2]